MKVAGTDLAIISLRCRDCGSALDGLATDRVFVCNRCRIAGEVKDGALRWWPFRGLAHPGGGDWMYLPFWEFEVASKFVTDDPQKELAFTRLPTRERVYVAGYACRGVSLFGDLGVELTFQQPALEPVDEGELFGCHQDCESAWQFVEPYLLSIADRAADITGVRLQVTYRGARLLAVPFRDDGTHLVDGIRDTRIPAAAFYDLTALRRARRARLSTGC